MFEKLKLRVREAAVIEILLARTLNEISSESG
jgi:hypothetical protein